MLRPRIASAVGAPVCLAPVLGCFPNAQPSTLSGRSQLPDFLPARTIQAGETMESQTLWLIVGGIVGAGVIFGIERPLLRRWRRARCRRAIQQFRFDREHLEAKFFELAARSGKPRGLRWLACDWQNTVRFARDVRNGLLTAFVSVEVRFEAEEGGDLEDVAAVGTVRDACALFHWDGRHWGTGGRALFNMDAHSAIARLEGQYAPVEQETPQTPGQSRAAS